MFEERAGAVALVEGADDRRLQRHRLGPEPRCLYRLGSRARRLLEAERIARGGRGDGPRARRIRGTGLLGQGPERRSERQGALTPARPASTDRRGVCKPRGAPCSCLLADALPAQLVVDALQQVPALGAVEAVGLERADAAAAAGRRRGADLFTGRPSAPARLDGVGHLPSMVSRSQAILSRSTGARG